MTNLVRSMALAALVFLSALSLAGPASAYSYAAAGKEPLIVNRENLLSAAAKGDWQAADTAYKAMAADLDYLDKNEDKGIGKAFTDAMASKNAQTVRNVLSRAYVDEIERRLNGARDNLKDYQTAKILVVKAQQFYTAMAGDVPPAARKTIETNLTKALDAVGNPGVFGVGAKKPDPTTFGKAHDAVLAALAPLRDIGK